MPQLTHQHKKMYLHTYNSNKTPINREYSVFPPFCQVYFYGNKTATTLQKQEMNDPNAKKESFFKRKRVFVFPAMGQLILARALRILWFKYIITK